MAIKLGSNIASLNAQRRLAEAGSELSKTFERLSSGQRINRASDDAAGLAIADSLKAKSRVYTQAIRNGNDGISLLNIADSAVDALTSVIVRIRELSEQAANGTYSSKQRAALDAEAQQLSKEFTRITQTTSFNGVKVFDGSLGTGVRLQLGIGTEESINASVGGAVGTGSFGNATTYDADSYLAMTVTLGDMNGDGILDMVTAGYSYSGGAHATATVRLGTGNGNFGAAVIYSSDASFFNSVTLGDLNGDGILDMVSAGYSTAGGAHGITEVRLGNGNGTFASAITYSSESKWSMAVTLGDLNGDGILDMVSAGDDALGGGRTTVRLGKGDGTFGASATYNADSVQSYAISLGDLNGDGILDLITAGWSITGGTHGTATVRFGAGDGSFGTAVTYTSEANESHAVTLGDLNGDGILDMITAGFSLSGGNRGTATVRLGMRDGTFGAATTYTANSNSTDGVTLGDLNGDGILDLITAGGGSGRGTVTVRLGKGDGSFGSSVSYSSDPSWSFAVTSGDLNGDGVLDLVTAGQSSNGTATVLKANTKEGLGSLLAFSLQTRPDSLQAMNMLDRTLQNLAKQRGSIGASQSRVNIAINNLQSARENFNAAESRIRDADIAQESAQLVRTQILQQAAASVLAQANQSPSLALKLLS